MNENGMKILIVDDSLLDRKLLCKTLQNLGVKNEVLQADHGEAALGVIARNLNGISLMFCDYQMPNMSGLELMEGLLKVPDTSRIPIVMVTASSAEESRKAAYAVNPALAGYVIKPYKPDEVLAVIKPYVRL
ncbi:MAG: response regulator [Candidatus Omnitrophica bacterium]|nr:response regulator [Candidatus Omnitrophota bacterium]